MIWLWSYSPHCSWQGFWQGWPQRGVRLQGRGHLCLNLSWPLTWHFSGQLWPHIINSPHREVHVRLSASLKQGTLIVWPQKIRSFCTFTIQAPQSCQHAFLHWCAHPIGRGLIQGWLHLIWSCEIGWHRSLHVWPQSILASHGFVQPPWGHFKKSEATLALTSIPLCIGHSNIRLSPRPPRDSKSPHILRHRSLLAIVREEIQYVWEMIISSIHQIRIVEY
jgi:hypothetical protein